MEFTFETTYDQKAFTSMARALRKTVRKKRNHRSHVFGWIVIVLGLLLTLLSAKEGFSIDLRTIITWLAILLILIVMFFEDPINGYIAKKRVLPGLDKSRVTFTAEGYSSMTDVGTSHFSYDKIMAIAETSDYFVFVFSASHAQVYDKSSLLGGTVEDFHKFIEEITHKEIEKI